MGLTTYNVAAPMYNSFVRSPVSALTTYRTPYVHAIGKREAEADAQFISTYAAGLPLTTYGAHNVAAPISTYTTAAHVVAPVSTYTTAANVVAPVSTYTTAANVCSRLHLHHCCQCCCSRLHLRRSHCPLPHRDQLQEPQPLHRREQRCVRPQVHCQERRCPAHCQARG